MLTYSRDALRFVKGQTRTSLDNDLVLARALSFTIAMIGEAALNMTPSLKDTVPTIPWLQLIGMRTHLLQEYYAIHYDRLWATVTLAIPSLIIELEKRVPPSEI
jgi:uncharacterized protein with HEPN domain